MALIDFQMSLLHRPGGSLWNNFVQCRFSQKPEIFCSNSFTLCVNADVWIQHNETAFGANYDDGRWSSPPGWSTAINMLYLLSAFPAVSIICPHVPFSV